MSIADRDDQVPFASHTGPYKGDNLLEINQTICVTHWSLKRDTVLKTHGPQKEIIQSK